MKTKIFLISTVLLLSISVDVQTANYPIKWSPAKIQQTLGLGDSKQITVSFMSNMNLSQLNLWVVPKLQPFINLEPNYIDYLEANTIQEIKININVPYNTISDSYNGTIHVKGNSKTLPQNLKISLLIVDVVKTVGTDGGDLTTTDGLVNLHIPSGSLTVDTEITISPTGNQGIGGEIYEFGPLGLNFQSPVSISYTYYQSLLDPSINEEDLFLASINDYLEILDNIQVDKGNNIIIGEIGHFSNIGPGAFVSNLVNVNDFDTVTSFRMPIGDAERIIPPQTPPPCGYFPSYEDVGENLDLLDLGTNLTFNDGVPYNEWYVSVKFLEPYFLGWHPGEDWNDQRGENSDLGSPIHAIADGIILYNKNEGNGFGNIVVIGHKLNGGIIIASVYAHLLYQSPCPVGTKVNKGDVIGLLGDTGGNWFAHLHFELTNENYPYIKVDNSGNIKLPILTNKGWHWPGSDKIFIENYYHAPSSFIKATQEYPSEMLYYWKFDDGIGTIAVDSADANPGTLINGPVWTSGQVGSALSFDGLDDYVSTSIIPPISGSYTVEAWIKASTSEPEFQYIVCCTTEGPGGGFALKLKYDKPFFLVYYEDGRSMGLDATISCIGDYYHLVGVYNDITKESKIFINGELDGIYDLSNFGSPGVPTLPISIGGPTSDCYFNGSIDEVAIYEGALDITTIRKHYQNGLVGLGYLE